jgi:uncharacterized protein (TIGR03067 family)
MHASTGIVLAVAVITSVALARADEADRTALQGRWKIAELTPADEHGNAPGEAFLVIGRDTIREESKEAKKDSGGLKYRLDPSKEPKQIDLLCDKSPKAVFDEEKGNFRKGIYRLDGDDLKLCFYQEDPFAFCRVIAEIRPRDFKDEHVSVMVLRRVKQSAK